MKKYQVFTLQQFSFVCVLVLFLLCIFLPFFFWYLGPMLSFCPVFIQNLWDSLVLAKPSHSNLFWEKKMCEEDTEIELIELEPQETSIQKIHCSALSALLASTLWLMGRGCSSQSKPLCVMRVVTCTSYICNCIYVGMYCEGQQQSHWHLKIWSL